MLGGFPLIRHLSVSGSSRRGPERGRRWRRSPWPRPTSPTRRRARAPVAARSTPPGIRRDAVGAVVETPRRHALHAGADLGDHGDAAPTTPPGQAPTRSSSAAVGATRPLQSPRVSAGPTDPTLAVAEHPGGLRGQPSGRAFRCTADAGPATEGQLAGLGARRRTPRAHHSRPTVGRLPPPRRRPNRYVYKLAVQAYVPAVVAPGRPEARGRRHHRAYAGGSTPSTPPRHNSPPAGARFNNPTGGLRSRRVNLSHVIRTINSMPGYAQGPRRGGPCPTHASRWPSTIRISLYSMFDGTFARAMRAAHRRCVSVQILMNNHLSGATDPPWRAAAAQPGPVGARPRRRPAAASRSAATTAAAATGVLHTKMYLFDSERARAVPLAQPDPEHRDGGVLEHHLQRLGGAVERPVHDPGQRPRAPRTTRRCSPG